MVMIESYESDPSMIAARHRMVVEQLERRGIRERRVLEAMDTVPREAFVRPEDRDRAYLDQPLAIGSGQTISQPYVVAAMLEALRLGDEDRALDVGTGSGYAAAVLARVVTQVWSIERHADLAARAGECLRAIGCTNVEIRVGDGTRGWPEAAPFDAIVVAAGGPRIPPALTAQLSIGGRLVIPVGGREEGQTLTRVIRRSESEYDAENLGDVRFVPLRGAAGWPVEEEDRPPDTR